MSGFALWRCLAAAAVSLALAHGQSIVGSAITGQQGSSFPGACPISKLSDVIVTTIATLPKSTTSPLTLAYSAASNFPYGQPTSGFITSPSWNLLLNNTAPYFTTGSSGVSGLKFFGECKQNLLTLQATCSFVFDYSTRRLLDLLSKATPAGGIPLGGTVTFQFCTLSLGNSQVSSPTCFESRGGAPKPVIVKISSKEPADVIPPIGFNACYKDTVGSSYKCLAFSIIQSCADSSQLAMGSPIATPSTGGLPFTPPTSSGSYSAPASGLASTNGGSQTLAGGQGSSDMSTAAGAGSSAGSAVSTPGAAAQPGTAAGASAQGSSASASVGRPNYSVVPNAQGAAAAQSGTSASLQSRSQQIYAQGTPAAGQGAQQAQQQQQAGRRRHLSDRL
ncbi:hypothetical protein CVIRNUC_009541 [Coccomyxa viridis]|uniref:Extracellular protein n=1 Tax=Coccomyxa viridis TaxID=1274662 RepID=A0AAV1IK91_9CHLO|nr:hypothetical protein CVIRNUC_009541 [Coccomyxa viridis]